MYVLTTKLGAIKVVEFWNYNLLALSRLEAVALVVILYVVDIVGLVYHVSH